MMNETLPYSFADEIVTKFCYDIDNKMIKVSFLGYYDLLKDKYIEKSCSLIISSWLDGKSKLSDQDRFTTLESNIGIFSMILSIEKNNENLEITINTLDNRYIDLFFLEPNIKLVVEP